MIRLGRALAAWGTRAFDDCFRAEVEALDHSALPLQQGLSLSSCVSDEPFRVMVIGAREAAATLHIKAGVFYSGVVAGCSCADDPSPTDLQTEYCVLEFIIDRQTAAATVRLLPA